LGSFAKNIVKADLYAPDKMPTDLREAHDRNDEVLDLYTKMTVKPSASNQAVECA
jgi:hypothetical protein